MSLYKFLIVIGIAASGSIFAQNNVKINISFSTDQSKSFTALYFGADVTATAGLDTALGEKDLPNMKPPGDPHGWFQFYDSTLKYNVVSYIDMRPFPGANPVVYQLEVHNIIRYINFTWKPVSSPMIDSIFLEDNFDELNIVRENMMTTNSYSHDTWKSDLDKFYIKVWYKNGINNIAEESAEDKNILNIKGNLISFGANTSEYGLYSIDGQLLASGYINNYEKEINIENYPTGLYLMEIKTLSGNIFCKKILKY